MFRSSGDTVIREEVIVLITPRIIKYAADEVASEQLRDDIERFRLGMRQNLNWFGRARLAGQYLVWAKHHQAMGNTDAAMWDLNMTLSLSPAMQEALQLKEHLTGKAIWANEPRLSSARWVIQKMIANELGINVNRMITPNKPLDANELPEKLRDSMGIGNTPEAPVAPTSAPVELKTDSRSTDSGSEAQGDQAAQADAEEDADQLTADVEEEQTAPDQAADGSASAADSSEPVSPVTQ